MAATIDKNGRWVDDGEPVGSENKTCPKCGRPTFVQTVSTDSCSSCGYFFDYWSGDKEN